MNRYGVSWSDSETKQMVQANAESEKLMEYLEASLYQRRLIAAAGELTSRRCGFGIMMYYRHSKNQLLTAQPRRTHPYIHVVITSGVLNRQTLLDNELTVGNHLDPTPDVKLYSRESIDKLLHLLEKSAAQTVFSSPLRKAAFEISEAFVDENLDQLISFLKSGDDAHYLSFLHEIRYTKWFEAWLRDPEIQSLAAHLTELDLYFRDAYERIAPFKSEAFESHKKDPFFEEVLRLKQRLSVLFSREYFLTNEPMTELQRLEEMHEITGKLQQLQKRIDQHSIHQEQNH